MALLDEVLFAMQANGLPPLPNGHPICDGKERRFGRRKKAWYKLNEIANRDGKRIVYGVFGYWRGQDNGAVGVTLDGDEVSKEELAAACRKQEEAARQEEEKRAQLAAAAANRAKMQWDQARAADPERKNVSPYLERKQVAPEGVLVTGDGTALIPMIKYGTNGARLIGLQKIAADGSKRFNKGMDKVGASCRLGKFSPDAPLILCGEGYATMGSVRRATDREYPAAVAFDAGNLMTVAEGIRKECPSAHILFTADDDWQLHKRLAKWLVKEFKIAATIVIDGEPYPLAEHDFDDDVDPALMNRLEVARAVQVSIAIDGREHKLTSEDGTQVLMTAESKKDGNGIAYVDADVRAGRQVRTMKFENAGIAKATAAARAVGNASVIWPVFRERGCNKWTDFNDLHVEQSLDDVREQLSRAIERGLAVRPAFDVSPAPFQMDAALNPVEALDVPGEFDAAAPPDLPVSPPPLDSNARSEIVGLVSLEWALAHCALVQGSTDVWDSLNKLRMKRPAFVAMVGKEAAKTWESHTDRRSISPRNLPKMVRGVAVASVDGGAGGDDMLMMLERYTLLYPTKTLWDAEKKTIASYDAVALARGADLTARWLAHPLHMEKDLDKLVFDPTQKVDLNTHINMFEGFPLTPKQDDAKAELVLDLLYSLCSSEDNAQEVFEWVLRWLAYPLQHPGAKMQTALLFFGHKQGTGKSLFFEGIVKPIYGSHGATGGQHQLEAPYTAWRSQKLFVLFEEILSRQDKYSHFGLIKHMITGRDTPITQKFKDDRTEANHLNVVMLSNEFQAVPLEPDDRRFLVADVRASLDPGLLARIKAVLDDGLIEAFYHFLLNYPLNGFDPHTKPVMTDAKRRVIRFGLPAWDSFYQAWSGGELEAPFCACLSEDLYRVYDRWCNRTGERSMSLTKFSELIATRVPKSRQHVALGVSPKKLLTVFQVPSDTDESLSKQCQRFRDLADIKERA